MDWQATVFWPALRPLFIELVRTPPAKREADVVSKGENLSLSAVRILDARLSGRTFLAGESFTMGDIPAAATLHRWYALDIDHPELPNVQRWYDLMKLRPPFRDVVMTPLS
jgi:glutathione S-transferase